MTGCLPVASRKGPTRATRGQKRELEEMDTPLYTYTEIDEA